MILDGLARACNERHIALLSFRTPMVKGIDGSVVRWHVTLEASNLSRSLSLTEKSLKEGEQEEAYYDLAWNLIETCFPKGES